MASPHVAGLAAYLLSQTDGALTGAELKAKMLELSTKDVVADPGEGSPNKLIYNDAPKL
ncbi:hypothetical protein H4S02_010431 [Coemansia sp. RSA 2611]|nr:hypothetical protein IWW52_000951 [Coemansia sp. RSA 2704]KAJ2322675.1 proteinase B [Coemansia sp. RSA 2702]KAJ2366664.1 hypothetical protein H4S02_010431 [Coemansia sp. RSA 2611]KAJ2738810.1 proteinase B [Coemansia sp. Cherry 401B]